MKEKLKAFLTRENIVTIAAIIGVVVAVLSVLQTYIQLEKTQQQLDIAKEQIAVPQLVEAIKLLERKSFLSKKSAVRMFENLAITNQGYAQQSVDILLEITSKYMKNKECPANAMEKLKNAKNNTQEEIVNKALNAIANILKKSKNLNLSNAWLCGLKIFNDKNIEIFADFNNAKLQYSEFKNIDLSNSNLSDVDFRNSNLSNISFKSVNLQNSDFRNAKLTNVTFEQNNKLSGIKFFDITPVKIKTGTKIKKIYAPNFHCITRKYLPEIACPDLISETEVPTIRAGTKGKNQTSFDNVDFTNANFKNVNFGCKLDKDKLDLTKVRFGKNIPCK